MVQTTIALRVDVDTRRGLASGVPRLLETLGRLEVRASFFVTMGPDRSGAAIRRLWRPGFIAKMLRTNPFRLYGVRTLLSGTLLPAEPVGAAFPDLLRVIVAEGHELAPHGFDHVGWQDGVHRWSPERIHEDMTAAARSLEAVLGTRPESSAAPGWRTTPTALAVQEEFGYRYASDVRGAAPFRPIVGDGTLKTLQIPTTMPTMDELMGRVRDIATTLDQALQPGLNVLTLHAEVEGGPLLGIFREFVNGARARGAAFTRLDDVAEAAWRDPERLPSAPVSRNRVAGRSGWVAAPGILG